MRTARGMGVNVTDMTAIMQLSEHGPMGVAELARRLGVSPPATTVLVDRLERSGHVERVRDSVDRRRVRITDTTAGRAATREAWLPAIREIDDVCRSLSGPEQRFARDLLERLTSAMTAGGRPRPDDSASGRRGGAVAGHTEPSWAARDVGKELQFCGLPGRSAYGSRTGSLWTANVGRCRTCADRSGAVTITEVDLVAAFVALGLNPDDPADADDVAIVRAVAIRRRAATARSVEQYPTSGPRIERVDGGPRRSPTDVWRMT